MNQLSMFCYAKKSIECFFVFSEQLFFPQMKPWNQSFFLIWNALKKLRNERVLQSISASASNKAKSREKKKHWLRLKCIEYFKNRFQSCPYLFTPYMLGTKWKKKVVYCTFHKCFSISYNLKLLECRCLEISINFLFSRFSCKHQWQQWFLVVISFY